MITYQTLLAILLASGLSVSCQRSGSVADEDAQGAQGVGFCGESCDPLPDLDITIGLAGSTNQAEYTRGDAITVGLTVTLPPENVLGNIYVITDANAACDVAGTTGLVSVAEFPVVEGESFVNVDTTNIAAGSIRLCSHLSLGQFARYDEISAALSLHENIYLSKGYVARSCGFDTNGDGNVGYTGDCNICDGQTTDIDGDSQDEDLWYIDATSGSDAGGCGTASNPCQSIQYALNNLDGPSTGGEDIICISGVFDETLTLTQSGQAGFVETNNFQVPQNPFMIVGWDKDGDGEYPPYDTDDTAVLDSGDTKDLVIDGTASSYVEIAHLTVRNYGGGWNRTYFIDEVNPGNSHIYLHDILFEDVNDGAHNGGMFYIYDDQSVPNGSDLQNAVSYILIENNHFNRIGSPVTHMTGDTPTEVSFVRVRNNTVIPRGSTDSTWNTNHHIHAVQDVEITHNVYDTDYDTWTPQRALVANIGNCTQRFYLSDNVVTDHAELFNGFLDQGECESQPVDDVYILRNQISVKNHTRVGAVLSAGYRTPNCKADTASCDVITNVFQDIFVAGNHFKLTDTTAQNYFIQSTIGNAVSANPGRFHIVANTFDGLGMAIYNDSANDLQNYTIANNIFTGIGAGKDGIGFYLTVSGYIGANNFFDGPMDLRWGGTPSDDLADFKNDTGTETGSLDSATAGCSPSFLDALSFDYRLSPTDTCVTGIGGDISSFLATDIGGDVPSVPANAGADQ